MCQGTDSTISASIRLGLWLVTVSIQLVLAVTGQLADTPTRGLPTRGLDILRTGQLADWTSHGLDNSRSRRCRQKRKTKHAKSPMASASCPVRDLSSMRVV